MKGNCNTLRQDGALRQRKDILAFRFWLIATSFAVLFRFQIVSVLRYAACALLTESDPSYDHIALF
eukprot:6106187-Amphidinium_carterae.1